nr:hypothetical protein [Tanacetum cinerariifolium]
MMGSSVRCLESVSKIIAGSDDWLIDVGHAYLSVVRVALRIWWIVAGTNAESEHFEVEARTPESPHIVAPPTCHVEESKGSGTSGGRSTSSDSTAPLSPDHPLTHTTPVLVYVVRKTARMAVCVPPVMSPSLSASVAEMAAMSSYDSSPSPTLPVRKRYRGTSKIILGTNSEADEEVEESLYSDSESEDVEDEGPTAEDEDPVAEGEGLAARVEDLGLDDKSYGLDDESHGVDDESYSLDGESYGLDDESRGIDDEGHGIESDGLGLGEEDAVTEGQQRVVSVVGTAVSEPLGLGYGALRRRELALEDDHVYSPKDNMIYIDVLVYTPLAPPSPEGTFGSLPISPSLSVVPLPVSSPMIPLTVPSPIATSTATIPVNEDQFIEGFYANLKPFINYANGLNVKSIRSRISNSHMLNIEARVDDGQNHEHERLLNLGQS